MLRIVTINFLGILLACIGNENEFEKIDDKEKAFGLLSPVDLTKSETGTAFPQIFEYAFIADTIIPESQYQFFQSEIGKIKLLSGKIIAGDPININDLQPYKEKFPIGDFPFQIAHADSIDGRVAFCRVLFSSNAPVKWELARLPGQKFLELTDSNFYCFGIDAGTGVVLDKESGKKFNEKENNTSLWDRIEKNNYQPLIYTFDKYNLACFGTGWGDGCYASYIGYDINDEICRLLLDFQFVEWWTEQKP